MEHSVKLTHRFSEKNIAIYTFTDNYYAPYLGVALCSMLHHADVAYNYDIFVMENNVSQENKMKFLSLISGRDNCSIRFIDMVDLLSILNVVAAEHLTINSYAKIFALSDLFREYDRILSLDSDILVQKDISGLFFENLQGKPIAAVKDTYLPVSIKRNFHADKRLNYKPVKLCYDGTGIDTDDYFNAGVILYDLKECRRRKFFERTIEVCNQNPLLVYMEQDVLNMVFRNEWRKLGLDWNGMSSYSIVPKPGDFPEDYEERVKNAAIVHFLGGNKPWEDKNAFLADVYMESARRSPWKIEVEAARENFEIQNKVKGILLPKGSRRREWYRRMWFAAHDLLNGWK